MWKTHFILLSKGVVFHRGCGKRCGKLSSPVDKNVPTPVFEFSTGSNVAMPVEMWKTRSYLLEYKELNRKPYCGKLFDRKVG
jgi:hypothetical protein